MNRRTIALANVALTVGVLVPTTFITHTYIVRPHQVEGLGDWISMLLPFVPIFVSLYVSYVLLGNRNRGAIGVGLVWGAFVASVAFMGLQALTLITQFTLISQDGEAHWAMLELPVVWIALPALITGMLAGAVVGTIRSRRRPNQAL